VLEEVAGEDGAHVLHHARHDALDRGPGQAGQREVAGDLEVDAHVGAAVGVVGEVVGAVDGGHLVGPVRVVGEDDPVLGVQVHHLGELRCHRDAQHREGAHPPGPPVALDVDARDVGRDLRDQVGIGEGGPHLAAR